MKVKATKKTARKSTNIAQKSLRNDNVKNIGCDYYEEYEYYDIKDFNTCCTCEYFYDNEMETRFECHKKARGKECYESKYDD